MFGWLKRKRAAEVKTLQDAMMAKMFAEPVAATAEVESTRARILEQAMADFQRPSGYGEFTGFYVAPGYVPHSWGVFQSGKMLSTYTLKSNATRAARRLNGDD